MPNCPRWLCHWCVSMSSWRAGGLYVEKPPCRGWANAGLCSFEWLQDEGSASQIQPFYNHLSRTVRTSSGRVLSEHTALVETPLSPLLPQMTSPFLDLPPFVTVELTCLFKLYEGPPPFPSLSPPLSLFPVTLGQTITLTLHLLPCLYFQSLYAKLLP